MPICVWWCFKAEFKVGSTQITRKVITLYYRMTNWYFNWSCWIMAFPPGVETERRMSVWDGFFDHLISLWSQSATACCTLLQQKKDGRPCGQDLILCRFPGGTSVALIGRWWMRRITMLGALCHTFRWHHFNYVVILSLWRAYSKPGSNRLP